MTSLRRRLLSALWIALLLVGASSAAATFFMTRDETNSLLDYQMEQIATFIGAQSFAGAARPGILPRLDIDRDDEGAYTVSVRDAAGRLQYSSGPDLDLAPPDWLGLRTIRVGSADYRVLSAESGTARITVAQQMELRRETAAGAALMALVPVAILIPVLGLLISFIIRRQLQPLTAAARDVARRPPLALDPLPVAGLPPEVSPLIQEINRLLLRLRAASEHEQRFIADAAHALRTPLAALQLQADVVDGAKDAAERAARTADLRMGIRRTVRLANHLLLLARNDKIAGPVDGEIALDVAVRETCDLYAPIAAARGVRLQVGTAPGSVVPGDARHVAQLAGSLLDNAIRHTPPGGQVMASVTADAGNACIEVVDEGPGLPEAELEKVFERFYRVKGDATEGSGLGLAMVREIAVRLGGRASLANRKDRSGLVARVCLPLATAAESASIIESSSCA